MNLALDSSGQEFLDSGRIRIALRRLSSNLHTQWYPEALSNRTRRHQSDGKSTKRRIIKDMHRMVLWRVELKCSALE
ncbi:hypothetical protein R3I94_000547 [Phoxinus phoxinus]